MGFHESPLEHYRFGRGRQRFVQRGCKRWRRCSGGDAIARLRFTGCRQAARICIVQTGSAGAARGFQNARRYVYHPGRQLLLRRIRRPPRNVEQLFARNCRARFELRPATWNQSDTLLHYLPGIFQQSRGISKESVAPGTRGRRAWYRRNAGRWLYPANARGKSPRRRRMGQIPCRHIGARSRAGVLGCFQRARLPCHANRPSAKPCRHGPLHGGRVSQAGRPDAHHDRFRLRADDGGMRRRCRRAGVPQLPGAPEAAFAP